MASTSPVIVALGRLAVTGTDCIPASDPTLIISNHDSYWDPIAVGMAEAIDAKSVPSRK
jgi:1-acyl-sn-glycerol-3-phosphate acyltransferase